jgi:phosphonate transport system substrate-binding protein
MRVVFTVFLLLFVMSVSLFSQQIKTIQFTPLPTKKAKTNIEDFLPLAYYLQKALSIKIEFNYKYDYADILKGFEDQSIDITVLGPLPYKVLEAKYPYLQPIVAFKQKDGSVHYRCVLSKFSQDILDFSKPLKIALTQPLSTCGYYMSSKLLKKRYKIELKDQYYDYTMSHTNAVTGALKGEFNLAGSTEYIAQKYKSLGMEIIAKSELLAGFTIVVNTKTLSKQMIEELTQTILNISDTNLKKWGGKTKYGFSKINKDFYKDFKIDFKIPTKGNMP